MKKAASLIMALALCATLAVGVSANQTTITYTHENDPTYTITIPADIELAQDGTDVDIVASDVNYLGDKVISVTFAGTHAFRHQFLLNLVSGTGSSSIRYGITMADGSYMTTTGDGRQLVGTELVQFSDNGTKAFTITPITDIFDVQHGNEYTGSITYGIELVEA